MSAKPLSEKLKVVNLLVASRGSDGGPDGLKCCLDVDRPAKAGYLPCVLISVLA